MNFLTAPMMTQIFIGTLIMKLVVQHYLGRRQIQSIITNRHQVPDLFKQKIELDEHQKAADYCLTKLHFAGFKRLVSTAMLLVWTLLGGLEALAKWSYGFNLHSMLQALIFFAGLAIIDLLIEIPLDAFRIFYIEERFGMNNTTLKIFIADFVKRLLLLILIGAPILAGILSFIFYTGAHWWMGASAFLIAVQLLLSWAYPTFLAPLFNKFSHLPEGEVKSKIEELLSKVGFESGGLYTMDASKRSTQGNAYFTGFGKAKRIVIFDTLIESLDPKEIQAVLAHELGHFKKKHVLKMMAMSIVSTIISFFVLSKLLNWPIFFQGHGIRETQFFIAPVGLALFSTISGTYTFFLTPLLSWWSRKYEFEADEFASIHSDAQDLINSLVKLYRDNASTTTPDKIYSAFYDSHPPAPIRMARLSSYSRQGHHH